MSKKEILVGQLVGSNNTTVASIDTKGKQIFVNMSHLVTLKFEKDLSFNADRDVFFYLSTRSLREVQNVTDLGKIEGLSLFPPKPTRILIHDYQDGLKGNFYTQTVDAYFKKDDFNVVSLDLSLKQVSN